MVLALGVEHSTQAAEAQRKVTDMTNELLKKNAEKLQMATVETAKESERGIVDIETLKATNESLINTLDEVADPQECKKIADLGIDFLAAGIGNIHGKYPANWQGLDFDALAAIKAECGNMPLVLHGGTGIPEEMIKKAISLGVCKINVNTECQLYFAEATRKYIEAGKDLEKKGFDPRKLLAPGTEAIKEIVKIKMEMFGCVGKAF